MASSSKPRSRSDRQRSDGSQAIITAGLTVLEERGWDGFTIAEVAARAGLSVGGIYNRFVDKEAFTLALHEAFNSALVATGTAQRDWSALSLDECLRVLVRDHCKLMSVHAGLMRVFMRRTAVDESLALHASESTRALGRAFQEQILEHRHEIPRPDAELATAVCFEMVHDVTARRVARGEHFESDVELSLERLSQELSRVCIAYLRAPVD
jgi:AcrR family transcriptional regulator